MKKIVVILAFILANAIYSLAFPSFEIIKITPKESRNNNVRCKIHSERRNGNLRKLENVPCADVYMCSKFGNRIRKSGCLYCLQKEHESNLALAQKRDFGKIEASGGEPKSGEDSSGETRLHISERIEKVPKLTRQVQFVVEPKILPPKVFEILEKISTVSTNETFDYVVYVVGERKSNGKFFMATKDSQKYLLITANGNFVPSQYVVCICEELPSSVVVGGKSYLRLKLVKRFSLTFDMELDEENLTAIDEKL